jgi:hypothetical protein
MKSNYSDALDSLEQAHIVAQPSAWPHLIVHWKMLMLAWKYKNWHEFIGQIPRLILAIPGSLSGKAPKGNVGSTRMGIFEEKK